MDYKEALEFIYSAEVYGSVLGLGTMKRLLEAMGNPQKGLKFVHVAGTNGKGSVCAYLSGILSAAGYKTGLYVSPYVQEFGERIQVNGKYIPEDALAEVTQIVKEKSEELVRAGHQHPTVFELMTAIGFEYFRRSGCDIVVLEVGLGGRLDATNIIDSPEVAVMVNIGFDHIEQLGNTLQKIAFEKAGIIKPGCDTVLYLQKTEVMEVIKNVCAERGSRLHIADGSKADISDISLAGMVFDWENYEGLKTALLGIHQVKNAATAVRAAEVLRERGWRLTDDAIRLGLKSTRWVGRLEVLSREPVFIVDGAHNPQGVETLLESLKLFFGERRFVFIMGVLGDKDYHTSVKMALPMAKCFFTVSPPMEGRSLPAEKLAGEIKSYGYEVEVTVCKSIPEAVMSALDQANEDDVICAFGSLYQIGEIRRYFNAVNE